MKTVLILICLLVIPLTTAAAEKGGVQKLILEEQKVEGKIRRPQLVLIKADQRPAFPPMANQSFGTNPDIVGFVDKKVLDYMPSDAPFMFSNRSITNYQP
jgi:hypothetical protein